MQEQAPDPARHTPTNLTAAQVADRMGLTTRQLQELRLRGVGPQIMQRGLSIHYLLADIQDIERHEAAMLIEQVLATSGCQPPCQPCVRVLTRRAADFVADGITLGFTVRYAHPPGLPQHLTHGL